MKESIACVWILFRMKIICKGLFDTNIKYINITKFNHLQVARNCWSFLHIFLYIIDKSNASKIKIIIFNI